MVQISLGMTVFNRDRFLETAIKSVLGQSFTDWELIIVDDGSTDRSVEIAQKYKDQDPRIHVTCLDANYGAGYALYEAMSQARGEFVGWVDSDDVLAPHALMEMLTALRTNPGYGVAYSNYRNISADGQDIGLGWRCQTPYSKDGMLDNFMMFHFRLIRRALYEAAGGIDPTMPASIEFDFCLRLTEITEVLHVPKSLYYYRLHGDSISSSQRSLQRLHGQLAVERAVSRRKVSVEV